MQRAYKTRIAPHWHQATKACMLARELADGHYTRQTKGAKMWTRPGYNMILVYRQGTEAAAWCWWRPKWESGLLGTERKDGLRCIECTLFRNESSVLSSALIREACAVVQTWEHYQDIHLPDGLITGINSHATERRRSNRSLPGKCYREAGWVEMQKTSRRADVWLQTFDLPEPLIVLPYLPLFESIAITD